MLSLLSREKVFSNLLLVVCCREVHWEMASTTERRGITSGAGPKEVWASRRKSLRRGGGLVPIREKAHLVKRGCPSPSPSLSLSRFTTLDVNLRQGKFLESFLRSVTVFGVRRHRRRPFVGERRTVEVIFSCPSMSPTKRESALAAARRSRRIAANGRCSAVCR